MGGDRYDEVWNGVYVMSPIADNSHQDLVFRISNAIDRLLEVEGSRVLPGCNVSDRADDWTKNYRCPDVVVFLPGNPAEDRETHYLGGPDFAVEILSRGDRARKKFDFYAVVGVKELLLVVRNPWKLQLYRHEAAGWELVGDSRPRDAGTLRSETLDLDIRLLDGTPRPKLEFIRRRDGQTCLA